MALSVVASEEEETEEEHRDVAQPQHGTRIWLLSVHVSLSGCSDVAHPIPRGPGAQSSVTLSHHTFPFGRVTGAACACASRAARDRCSGWPGAAPESTIQAVVARTGDSAGVQHQIGDSAGVQRRIYRTGPGGPSLLRQVHVLQAAPVRGQPPQ